MDGEQAHARRVWALQICVALSPRVVWCSGVDKGAGVHDVGAFVQLWLVPQQSWGRVRPCTRVLCKQAVT